MLLLGILGLAFLTVVCAFLGGFMLVIAMVRNENSQGDPVGIIQRIGLVITSILLGAVSMVCTSYMLKLMFHGKI
jgi:drug/metabolite transporter (DMT)-like permease